MADIKSPEERSRNMSLIRSNDTKPEIWLRKQLFSHGYRYRKNVNGIPGRPDIWLAKYNTAVFVNGCFWHRHDGCKYAYMPKSRAQFWTEKFQKNVERDAVVARQLDARGIRRLVVWECTVNGALKRPEKTECLIRNIQSFLISEESSLEL